LKLTEETIFDIKNNKNKTVYKINNGLPYSAIESFNKGIIDEVFDFAYGMSFGEKGHHRSYRSGGISRRKNGQIFADTFQGKLAEFALFNILNINDIKVDRPDNDYYGVGIWDDSDFNYKNNKISVKSTKSFGQLLLLEAADWTKDGLYIPNLGTGNEYYDYFVLVRLDPFITNLMYKNRIYFSSYIEKSKLRELILHEEFTYDIPGCMTRKTLAWLIKNNYLIKQGGYINNDFKNNKLDADNYYIQANNLFPINKMINCLKFL